MWQDDPAQQIPRQDNPTRHVALPASPVRGRTQRHPRPTILLGAAACLLVLLGMLALVPDSAGERQAAAVSAAPAPTTPPAFSPAPRPPPEPAELEQTVRTYYGLLPDDPVAAWEFLDSSERAKAGGLAGYVDFWNGIDDVRIRGPLAVQDNIVLVNLRFEPEGRSRTLERYQLTMSTAADGRVLIESSSIIGSIGAGEERGGRSNQTGSRGLDQSDRDEADG